MRKIKIMEATVIDFKKKRIAVPDRRPYLKLKEVGPRPLGFKDTDYTTVNFFGGVDKVYELIELHSIDKAGRKMTQRFFVNQDDIEIAFPIINAMVRNRTKNLEEERQFADISYSIVKKKYDRLKSFWFNRAIEFCLDKLGKK